MTKIILSMMFSLFADAAVLLKVEEQIHNSQLPIEQRWQSMMSLITEHKANQQEVNTLIDKSLLSSDWLLRSAALQVLKVVDADKARAQAKQSLTDSAMMVRITSASVLRDLKDTSSVDSLKSALNQKVNFNKGESLPSRLAIVKALFDLHEDHVFWRNLEADKDPVVQELARHKSKKIAEIIR